MEEREWERERTKTTGKSTFNELTIYVPGPCIIEAAFATVAAAT